MAREIDIREVSVPREAALVLRGSLDEISAFPVRLRQAIEALVAEVAADVRASRERVDELEHRVASSRDDDRTTASAELRRAREQVETVERIERQLRERTQACLRAVQGRSAAVARDVQALEARLGRTSRALDELDAVAATGAPSVETARAAVAAAYSVSDSRHAAILAHLEDIATRAGTPPAPLDHNDLSVVASYADDAWSVGLQTLGKELAVTHPPASLPTASDIAGREAWSRSVYARVSEFMGVSGVPIAFFDEAADANGRLTVGGYTPPSENSGESIRINRQLLTKWGASDIVGTVVHELRHAEQQRVIDRRSFDPLSVLHGDRRAAWDKAAANYAWEGKQGTVAHKLYLSNPLELDAYASEAVTLDAYEGGNFLMTSEG